MRRRKRKLLHPKRKKEKDILNLISRFSFWFEEAVSPRLDDLSKEINELRERIQTIKQEIDEYEENHQGYDENGRPSGSYLDFLSELGGLDYEMDLLLMQKLSIEEMKLVCLYKEFEILLKEIIALSFPNTDVKNFFKWKHIKSILNSHTIHIGNIEGHNQINELRVVNNNIKHSNIIGEEVNKANIVEFELKDQFDCESLSGFYSRVRNEPIKFLQYLAEKIIEYLFVFDDGRIDKIASQYEERMEKETIIKLAEALKKKCA